MSNIFLDPNLYIFSEDEWRCGEALDRLDDLLRIMTDIDSSEEKLERSGAVLFLLPDEIYLSSLEMNPNINTPENTHYSKIFRSHILPSLMRRRANFVVGDNIDEILCDHVSVLDSVVPNSLKTFLESTTLDDTGSFIYVYHPRRISLTLESDAFLEEVCISSVSGRYFVEPSWVFPIEKKRDPVCSIIESVNINRERLLLKDAEWGECHPSGLFLHEDFVQSIADADFRELESEYKNKLIFTFLQVLCARHLTTNEHSMSPQTITYNRKKHLKWNAYVFKMGPDATDTRCSRLYYAKIKGGILFFRYEEDAHD